MADGRSRAVVSVIGRDQKGVVARVSTYLASADVNIEDIEQRVMEGLFIMTMLVDLSDCSLTLDELPRYLLKDRVVAVGEIGYDSMTPAEDHALEHQLQLAADHGLRLTTTREADHWRLVLTVS